MVLAMTSEEKYHMAEKNNLENCVTVLNACLCLLSYPVSYFINTPSHSFTSHTANMLIPLITKKKRTTSALVTVLMNYYEADFSCLYCYSILCWTVMS